MKRESNLLKVSIKVMVKKMKRLIETMLVREN